MKKVLLFLIIVSNINMFGQKAVGGVMPAASPQVIVYKTKGDYSKLVPITLSEDKKTVVNYPAKSDIYLDGVISYPTKLTKGYLLDNRGINKNSVFLNITYETYSKLENIDPAMLLLNIKDANPFVQMYTCGNRQAYKDLVEDLKVEIKTNKFKNCKCLTP